LERYRKDRARGIAAPEPNSQSCEWRKHLNRHPFRSISEFSYIPKVEELLRCDYP
jgi:hypothetical protein